MSIKKLNFKRIVSLLIVAILIIAVIFVIFIKKNNNIKESEKVSGNSVSEITENTINTNNIQTENTIVDEHKAKLEEKLAEGKLLSEKGLPVLMYHFFYDKKVTKGKDGNHLEISKFDDQMKYLSENDFYFPTWQEVEDYIDGIQELPEKSVVITVDDGDASFWELGVPVLQKYKIPATSFIITYWYGDKAKNKEEGISYQSHSYDMHKSGPDGKGILLSMDYDEIKEDVLLSKEVLGGADIFCYPFGAYTETSINVLKDTGYKLAFTTVEGRVKKGALKYELPRIRIDDSLSFIGFKSKVK